ncbi:MAG: excinuclease ABC subunit UvrC [Deltaproteobacteria bacterium]|nr:excinuclease ABC subunit UvrC [Deltaproteobacteria bacterium]
MTVSLAERVASLPTGPGVYLFKSKTGRVLYVGKAQNLRSRVRSYVSGGDGRLRIPLLVEQAADVDVVVTPNVKDALLLENELIKQHKPPFNVRLRDDKQYLALRLDPKEKWPRLTQVRRFRRDGARYFGPYTSSGSMREVLSNLRRIFPLRSCRDAVFRDYARRGRPCIEYEMKRCLGPCCGLVEEERYAELVHGTSFFLRGRSDELVAELHARMQRAAHEERFEEAARLRNQIAAVERMLERQQIVGEQPVDRDVFGLARRGGEVEVRVLHVREGRVVGAQGYGFSDVRLDDGDVMSSFLGQYFAPEQGRELPAEVLTPAPFEDDGALETLFADQARRKVALRAPQRGALAELVGMATANAELGLTQRLEARASLEGAIEELRKRLRLARPPRRIEGYDVSSFHGTLAVASRVVFEDGQPSKAGYRRYKIREAAPDDDYACLREVMQRRVQKRASEPLPDLILVDGGKGQLGVVTAVLRDAGLEVDCLGLAKERDEQSAAPRVRRSGGLKAERVFRPGRKDPVLLYPSSRGLLLLQRIRDESHRFAIEFQRSLRSKVGLTSILEELPGIGPGKRRALLKQHGSLRAVRGATQAELAATPGISARDAALIRRFFDAVAQAE